jgi:hypothetical protein
MQTFTAVQSRSESTLNLNFSGEISIDSNFPILNLRGVSQLNLDVGGVTYINSAGLRKWLMWSGDVNKNHPNLTFVMFSAPLILLRQISSIENFMPKNSKLASLYVPYFCEACDDNHNRLLEAGKDFRFPTTPLEIKNKINESTPCPKCGTKMIFDGNPDLIVSVLSRFA